MARRREEAFQRFATSSMPSEHEEIWRYSGIDAFDLDAYRPDPGSGPGAGAPSAVARGVAAAVGRRAALVVTHNGRVETVEVASNGSAEGLTVTGVRGVALSGTDTPAGLGELAGSDDAFGALHDAFVADAVVVRVVAKAVVGAPVVVVHLVDPGAAAARGDGRGVSVFPRALVALGPSAEAGVIEITAPAVPGPVSPEGAVHGGESGHGAGCLVVPVTELDVADDARLRYANLQVLDGEAFSVAVQSSRVGRDATLRSFTVGLGGRYARVRTDSDLVGQAGRTALLAAYLGTGEQIHDFRTRQDHLAPRSESELLFKGAVADSAHSVYSGLIRIRKGARGANALQTNHNLVLSEGAHADSVPNLDIDENDVRCSHASTVGPIDDEQRYYLETRGLEPAAAERLVVQGFFADLAARAPFPEVGRWVERAVAARLGGRLPAERQAGGGGGQRG